MLVYQRFLFIVCSVVVYVSSVKPPSREISNAEYLKRIEYAQLNMRKYMMDSMLLSTEQEIRYFSGFNSPFWASPTRPWFLIIRVDDLPIAVIPEIGRVSFRKLTWLPSENIYSWPSPHPEDDGVSLTSSLVIEFSQNFKTVGVPMGRESRVGMPVGDFSKWKKILKEKGLKVIDSNEIIKNLLNVKSTSEIEKMDYISKITSESFDLLPELYSPGDTEKTLAKKFQIDLISRGADSIKYMSVASGPDGYKDITSHPTDRILQVGDVFFMDIGAVYDGYFCDFDRHLAIGEPSKETKEAYRVIHEALRKGIKTSRIGVTLGEVFDVMEDVISKSGIFLQDGTSTGRMGHGVGMRLTEGFSIKKYEDMKLEAGMVVAIEPGGVYKNKFGEDVLMVLEENIVISESSTDPPRILSILSQEEIPVWSSSSSSSSISSSSSDINLGILIFKTDLMSEYAIKEMLTSSIVGGTKIVTEFSVIEGPGELTIENFRKVISQFDDGFSAFQSEEIHVFSVSCMSLGTAVGVDEVMLGMKNAAEAKSSNNSSLFTLPSISSLLALEALGLKKISVLTPYTKPVTETVINYFIDSEFHKFEVSQYDYLDLSKDEDISAIDPDEIIYESVVRLWEKDKNVDGIYISCTALASHRVIQRLEDDLGTKIVTSSQANLWNMLKLAGFEGSISGYGKLLSSFL